MIKIGIVGLPNAGKSTLFQLITKKSVEINNYPFSTINANVSIINYHDKKLDKLKEIYNSKEIIYSKIYFYDIAGLVKGASDGKGLGNKFLAHISETNIICHVINFFYANQEISLFDKFEIIIYELIMHDLKIFKNNFAKIKKKLMMNFNDKNQKILKIINKIYVWFENGDPLFMHKKELSKNDLKIIKPYNFLTLKPMIILLNVSEENYFNIKDNKEYLEFCKKIEKYKIDIKLLPLELLNLLESSTKEEIKLLFENKPIPIINEMLSDFINNFYKLLNLNFFYTCGEKECHSWTFIKNSSIKDASAAIHTDIRDKFIMAEVTKYFNIIEHFNEFNNIKNYIPKIVNKTYILEEFDIINVRIKK